MMDKTTRSAFAPPDVEQLPMEHAARQSSIFWGIAAGIAMIGIGLMAVFTPFGAGITLAYLITAGLGVYGITQLAAYIKTPANSRSAAVLINGILLAAFSALTFWASFQTPFSFIGLIAGLSVTVASFTILQSINQFIAFSQMRRAATQGSGWVFASGLLNALLSITLLLNPFAGWFAISTAWGIYLGVSGVALLVESLSGHRGRQEASE